MNTQHMQFAGRTTLIDGFTVESERFLLDNGGPYVGRVKLEDMAFPPAGYSACDHDCVLVVLEGEGCLTTLVDGAPEVLRLAERDIVRIVANTPRRLESDTSIQVLLTFSVQDLELHWTRHREDGSVIAE